LYIIPTTTTVPLVFTALHKLAFQNDDDGGDEEEEQLAKEFNGK